MELDELRARANEVDLLRARLIALEARLPPRLRECGGVSTTYLYRLEWDGETVALAKAA